MTLNPFFLNGSTTEQSLIQDLVNEQLRMYGVECYYLPRTFAKTNTIIREVIQSEFTSAYPLEAYVNNYEGFGGQKTLLSKFGIEEKDDLVLTISKERFENYITPLIKDFSNVGLATRPKEGDLIYFPLGDRLFEIKYVEHEQPFYQLRDTYVYELTCEPFRYEDEVLDTGVTDIDNEIDQIGYIQTLTMVGVASTATAITSYCASGAVETVYMTNMGGSYESQPTVSFSAAPAGGTTAVGVASITNIYANCNGEFGGKILAINLTNPGCGYTVAPWVTIQGGGGSGAAATTGICTTGSVGVVTITGGGSGYTTNPHFTFTSPGTGTTARGWGEINAAGIVTVAYIQNAGCGYTVAPTITIDAPTGIGATVGVGTYTFNEIVTGQTSGTTARVKKWTASTFLLEVSIVDGTFTAGEAIQGESSGAYYVLSVQNKDDLVTPFADNDTIEAAADALLDFTETNPFGMP